MTLNTERLILRPITLSDKNDVFEYSVSPLVGIDAGWAPHKNINETEEIIKTIFSADNVFGIVLKETGKMIGSVGFLPDMMREYNKALMIGYALGDKYWGKGIMTEAAKETVRYGFKELNLEIISVTCYTYNSRSRRVIEKLGFSFEGTLRQAEKRFDGAVLDKHCFSLTKKEFEKIKNNY